MTTITLIAENGELLFPAGGTDFDTGLYDQEDLPKLLLCRYDAGDCDICPWPMIPAEWSQETVDGLQVRLAKALFDEREMNQFFPGDAVILLPDGSRFDFDSILADAEEKARSAVRDEQYWERMTHAG